MKYFKTPLSLCKVVQIKQLGYIEIDKPEFYKEEIVCVLDSVWHELAIIVDCQKVLDYCNKCLCEKRTYLKYDKRTDIC